MKKNVCQWIWQWFKLPKLSQGEIGNLNSLISIKEIEFVDLKISLPPKINWATKIPLGLDSFTDEFYQ